MASIADNSVKIQTTSESNFSTPSWFGEVVVISSYLHKHGILSKINEQVRFAGWSKNSPIEKADLG